MNYTPKDSYVDWGDEKAVTNHNMICQDQAKLNFTWLVFPQIDELGINAVPAEYAAGLHEWFDKQTRAQLGLLPLTFMRYWQQQNGGDTVMRLSTFLPEDHLATMTIQAHKAQARLVKVDGNVRSVQFGKAA